MNGEIIAIGDELTSGRVLNTTSRYAAGMLFSAGYEITAMATVRDTPEEISEALKRAVKRSDFVIVTGGLGATSDDLTNEVVGETLGYPVVFHSEVFDRIKARLSEKVDEQTLNRLRKLAMLPTGAEILNPEARMAGYLLVHDDKPIFFLPGVPHEMKELLTEKVIPRLALWHGNSAVPVKQKVFKVFGLGETEINRLVSHLEEEEDSRVRIGYYPVFPEVHLSLTVLEENESERAKIFGQMEKEIETALGDSLFGADDDSMENVVGELLRKQKNLIATAESCSGGLIAHKITTVPGSSHYFAGGVVAYSNDLKEKLLGVDPALIVEHGAVSPEVAKAMAVGIKTKTSADIGLAVTGIAGPTGGTAEKPVGTVYIGLATPDTTEVILCRFSGDRWQVQELTAVKSLDLVRRLLLGISVKAL
ncbi:MAG: competence/damage-inducible protein A [Deltaproteobacteria bacterium]|jgi:nicotinamide-nucleotide amidase|nr:competence/damage-inducible protein A [Deltaproteobacteria bacterium]